MIGYIVDPQEGETYARPRKQIIIDSYELPVDTLGIEEGRVTTATKIGFDPQMFYLRVEGYPDKFWVVSKINTERNVTTITVRSAMAGLNNGALSAGSPTLGDLIHNYIVPVYPVRQSRNPQSTESRMMPKYICTRFPQFSDAIDIRNALPYDITSMVEGEGQAVYINNIAGAFQTAVENGWTLSFDIREETINGITGRMFETTFIRKSWQTATPIYFDDGHSTVISQSYEDDVISMVVVKTSEGGSTFTYYYRLLDDGSIGGRLDYEHNVPGNTVFINGTGSGRQAALDVFAQNTYKHSVVFESDKTFEAGQPVRLVLDRGVLSTVINKVEDTSSSERHKYTCGDLPATATQQIKAQNWMYGQRLPFAPKKGQLMFI